MNEDRLTWTRGGGPEDGPAEVDDLADEADDAGQVLVRLGRAGRP